MFTRNTVVRCGAPNHDNTNHNGALWFWAADQGISGTVNITDTDIIDSSFAGVTFWGSQINNINFSNVTINTSPYAIEVLGLSGSAYFTNVVAQKLTKGGVMSCDQNFKLIHGPGDAGWDDVHCNK